MNRFLYTFLLYLLSPFIGIYFFRRGLKDQGYWRHLAERFGFIPKNITQRRANFSECLHIHCASVGESKAAFPLIRSLREKFPNTFIIMTTSTPTGRAVLIKLIHELEINSSNVNIAVCYLPIDWLGGCKRFLDRANPSVSILMETELWPNLIHQLKSNAIPILLANARMSDSSLKKYLNYPQISFPMFASLSCIAAQFESDKNNFLSLGCNEKQLSIVGSVKFDIKLSNELKEEQQQLKDIWRSDRPCWIAASIHPYEFDIVLDTHEQLLKTTPNLLLIAVPRHPERFDALKDNCNNRNIDFICRTDNRPPTEIQSVVVGDSMGELMLLFGAADIAFVGGSLMDRGGHNPIEPAICGLPVIMGFSVYNFSDICQLMKNAGGLIQVENGQQLADTLKEALSNESGFHKKQQSIAQVISENKGSVNKQILILEKLLS